VLQRFRGELTMLDGARGGGAMEGGADYDDSYMGAGDSSSRGGSSSGGFGGGGGSRGRVPASADLDDEIPF
jgi:single-strand DNA-binding protein